MRRTLKTIPAVQIAAGLVFIILAGLALPAAAATGSERLETFFDGLRSLNGRFEQTLIDAEGNTVQQASGTFAIQRPDRFRWDYLEPYQQVIVADGERLWFYDTELEQVTVKPLDEAVVGTPAMLLSSTKPVSEEFAVTDLGARDELIWVELTPKTPQSNFDRVRLGFDSDNLARMEVQDSFGQVTRIGFSALKRNPSIEAELFHFVPPTGVDVVGGGQ